jgi:serine/threonine protein kinase
MGSHPADEEFAAFLAGRLVEARQEAIAAHLDGCAECRARLDCLADPADSVCRLLRQPDPVPASVDAASEEALRRLRASLPEREGGASGEPPAPEPRRFGEYRVLGRLSEGGLGTVYRAEHQATGREVALKVMRPQRSTDPAALGCLRREAESLARLRHPNLVRTFGVSQENGTPFLVLEYIDGESLADRLRRRRVWSPAEAAGVVRQVARGLAAVHEHGLVHRDVKPANILLEPASGRAVLTDFGLALAGEAAGSETGRLVGTPAYMSPEQIVTPDRVDARSDVYSLGLVLFELLTGERPFRAAMPLLLWQVLHEDPPPPRRLNAAVPPELESITLTCLSREPKRRYPTARALEAELHHWLVRQGARPPPV